VKSEDAGKNSSAEDLEWLNVTMQVFRAAHEARLAKSFPRDIAAEIAAVEFLMRIEDDARNGQLKRGMTPSP